MVLQVGLRFVYIEAAQYMLFSVKCFEMSALLFIMPDSLVDPVAEAF